MSGKVSVSFKKRIDEHFSKVSLNTRKGGRKRVVLPNIYRHSLLSSMTGLANAL